MKWNEKKEKLKEIYERFEKDAHEFKKGAICRIGCTYCCTDVGNVDINTLEGLIIWDRINTFPANLKRQLKQKLAQNRQEKEKQRVREEINLHFQESRRTHGKPRGGRIASYLTDEQRSQAGWIGASKCEVIFERAQSIAPCPFLKDDDSCLVYDIRPFSCRQLYSIRECQGRGPTVHRQAVALAKKAVREMQHLDDTGYSGHISFILYLLDKPAFKKLYLSGGFDPAKIMEFGKTHGIIINRLAK